MTAVQTGENWVVRVARFEGPLDLLLHLIGEAKIDIMDIFVSDITEQYIAYIESMGSERNAENTDHAGHTDNYENFNNNLDDNLEPGAASAFLEMAATLLYIKSRSLLPVAPDEADADEIPPEEALKRRLILHKSMKEQASLLRALETAAALSFTKLPEGLFAGGQPANISITNLTVGGMLSAWRKLNERVATSKENRQSASAALTPSLRTDPYPFEMCRELLLSRLLAERDAALRFEDLFGPSPSRVEYVSVFIALLELIRQGVVAAKQPIVFDRILIEKK